MGFRLGGIFAPSFTVSLLAALSLCSYPASPVLFWFFLLPADTFFPLSASIPTASPSWRVSHSSGVRLTSILHRPASRVTAESVPTLMAKALLSRLHRNAGWYLEYIWSHGKKTSKKKNPPVSAFFWGLFFWDPEVRVVLGLSLMAHLPQCSWFYSSIVCRGFGRTDWLINNCAYEIWNYLTIYFYFCDSTSLYDNYNWFSYFMTDFWISAGSLVRRPPEIVIFKPNKLFSCSNKSLNRFLKNFHRDIKCRFRFKMISPNP